MTLDRLALAALACLPLLACDHDHDDAEEVDQVAEGCKHMEFGPSVELGIDLLDPPTIETVHTRYDLTLSDATGGYTGLLDYTSAGGMHFLLFDQDVEFNIADAEGAAVAVAMVEDDPASCALAQAVHHVMLPAGTYSFYFDGVPTELLKMVVHVANTDHTH